MDAQEKERQLQERLARIAQLEAEVLRREKALKDKEKAKKQILLRLAPSLYDTVASLAEEDFRSVNAEIEYLLTQAVKARRK